MSVRCVRSIVRMLLVGLLNPLVAPSGGTAGDWQRLAAVVDEVTPGLMESSDTPGVSVVLIDGASVVWQQAYGVKRAGSDDRVTHETVFEACSMSKPVFGYAFLKLVEQQQMTLDRPLVEYLDKPYVEDQPLHEKISARMVLTHTSGFPNWRAGGWRLGGPLPVKFEPGSQYGYSGEGFWYLQQVVEHVVGEGLEPWIQRVLLSPLKMQHSSYVWQPQYETLAAAGHDAKGKAKKGRPLYDRANVAFSLYTTPTDYARFAIEILKSDRTAAHSLSGETIAAMLAPSVETGKPDNARCLGWSWTRRDERTLISHSGANGTGFRCFCRFDPVSGEGIVIMTNALRGALVWQGIVEAIDAAQRD